MQDTPRAPDDWRDSLAGSFMPKLLAAAARKAAALRDTAAMFRRLADAYLGAAERHEAEAEGLAPTSLSHDLTNS